MHNTIILADDHIVLRDALVPLVNGFPDFSVLAVAADGTEVVEQIQSGNVPNIVVLDLNMPKMDGFETAEWLKNNHPDIKILILTMFDSEIALIRLLQVGVKAFLKKDINPTELRNALTTVAADGYHYSHQTTGKLGVLFKKNNDNISPIEKTLLNDKEITFIKYASTELTYKEIADQMCISARTVDGYRDQLFEKLQIKSRVGLVLYAIKNNMIEL